MAVYWRNRETLIARHHDMADVPRWLRTDVSLRPEDEALVFSTKTYGKPILGGGTVSLGKRSFRKENQSILFYSGGVFTVPVPIQFKPQSSALPLEGLLHLDVEILKSQPSLIKERIVANYPGMSEIDLLAVSNLVQLRTSGICEVMFDGVTEENIRDPASQMKISDQVKSGLKGVMGEHGLNLRIVRMEWGQTAKEQRDSMAAMHELQLATLEAESKSQGLDILKSSRNRKKISKMHAEFMVRLMKQKSDSELGRAKNEREFQNIEHEERVNLLRAENAENMEVARRMNELELEHKQKMAGIERRLLERQSEVEMQRSAAESILESSEWELEIMMKKDTHNQDMMDRSQERKGKKLADAMDAFQIVQENKRKRMMIEKGRSTDPSFCPNCGGGIEGVPNFCMSCGAKL